MNIQMQAENFLNAYQVLRDNNEALIERLENSQEKSHIGTKMLGTRPTMGVDIVCLAFSVLKTFIMRLKVRRLVDMIF